MLGWVGNPACGIFLADRLGIFLADRKSVF